MIFLKHCVKKSRKWWLYFEKRSCRGFHPVIIQLHVSGREISQTEILLSTRNPYHFSSSLSLHVKGNIIENFTIFWLAVFFRWFLLLNIMVWFWNYKIKEWSNIEARLGRNYVNRNCLWCNSYFKKKTRRSCSKYFGWNKLRALKSPHSRRKLGTSLHDLEQNSSPHLFPQRLPSYTTFTRSKPLPRIAANCTPWCTR